jgi:hypothetical protein
MAQVSPHPTIVQTVIKLSLLILVVAFSSTWTKGLVLAVSLTLVYRYVIALILGLTVMPAMDLCTFYSE